MKRHFSKQSLLRTMMIVATLLFMMPAQNAWADNVATATVDGNTYTYSSLEAAVSAANGAQSTATVTLLKDITEQPCSLEVRKPMIIDLNNHRINTTTNYYLFYIELSMGQQMTIKNGSIRGRQNDVYIYKGEAVLENITAEAPSSGSNCVRVCSTCSLTVSKRITFDASIDNSGIVKVASGQTLYDKNGIEYSGYINSRVANLANNTLSSLVTVTANGITDTYNSLQDAVSAATYAYITYGTAATITLNHDITEQPCSLEVRKPMIIDLNGHVVNADNLTYAYGIFSIMNAEGQVIIKNGTISRRGVNDYNGFAIYNYNSNVELENVTVKNTYSTDNPCLYNNGTLTISKNITLVGSIKNSGTVQIVDGQLLGDASGKYYLGTLTSAQVDDLANNTLSSLVTVTANGTTTSYNSLQDAVSAAANAYTTYGTAATITLNHDITEQPCSLEVRKPMIIDLNGHVVNADNLPYAYGVFSILNNSGQVVIKNGTISRMGASGNFVYAIYNYCNDLILENVTVKNTYSAANPCLFNNGTLTISKNITLVGSINNSGTVQIVDGQLLGDASGKYYLGTLTSAQVDALSNNTLSSLSVVASGSCGTGVTWVLTGTSPNYTLTISGTGNMADYSLTNRPWVNYLDGIVTVVIEDGVESIGSDAFRNCTSLESVTISASVTSIGDYAFQNCTGLTSVTIPASVTSIGENAFCDTGLTTITIPASVTSIGNNAFSNCKLTSITLSEGLTTISAYAFSNNGTTIESVSIPQSVTSIGNCAFNGTSVQNFYINNVPSVLAIGENSPFKSSGVTIHVFALMKGIFENATNWSKYKDHFVDDIEITHVESVTLDNESMIVKTNASGKLNATINPADARVKDVVFTSSNDNIVHITDAATGEFLAGSQNGTATITCTALDGSGAYATCNVEVNNYLTPAESVTLNKTTNSLEVGGQFNLTATIYPLNVTYKNIVWRTSDETVATVNDGTVTAVAPGITTITAISQDGQARANCVVSVIGSCGTGVTWVLTGTSPNYTLTISGTGAMKDYGTPDDLPWKDYRSLIASVVIENGVTSVGGCAFEGCNNANLTSVTIPASVTSIGDYAFAYCTYLASVTIPVASLTYYGVGAFDNTADGLKIYVPGSALSTYKAATNWSAYINNFVGVYTVAFGSLPDGVSGVAPSMAAEGETVTLSFSGVPAGKVPGLNITYKFYDNDYDVYELKDNGDGTFSFVMPNGNVTVTASELKNDIKSCTATVPDQSLGTNSYINYKFWDTPATIGETVTDDETILTLGTDYQFGSITYADMTNHSEFDMPDNVGDECLVEIKGIGNYGGSKYVRFDIVNPSGNGTWGDLSWALSDGELTISGTGDMVKPQNDGTYPWLTYKSYIETITIEEGVTSIADGAFATAQNDYHYVVSTVNLPASLTSIGENAFAYCTGATITIPTGVTSIGGNAFLEVLKVIGSLNDNADNTTLVSLMHEAKRVDVTISGRTLYKDGNWNTLCLPFDVDGFDYTPLQDAIVQELDVDGYYNINNPTTRYIYSYDENNHKYVYIDESGNEYKGQVSDLRQTGFDALNGTLYLYFKNASSISAGTPYIIKWDAAATNIENPLFRDVTINATNSPVTSQDGKVQFRGIYSSTNIYSADHDNLFLGIGKNNQNEDVSMLYWPNTEGYTLGAFRAYFHVDLTETNGVRDIVLNFEDGIQTTGIIGHTDITDNTDKADAAWYSLDGRKLEGKPTKKGLYIYKGRKVARQ